MAAKIAFTKVHYKQGDKEFVARPLSSGEATAIGLLSSCGTNGDCSTSPDKCIGGKIYRCMASGGGSCIYYETNLPC